MTCLGFVNTILGVYRDMFCDGLPNERELFDKAICYIERNFHKKECTVLKLAQELSVSRSTLYREFVKKINVSPVCYLKKYRLKQAVKMLKKDKSITVSAVAFSCGYQNQYYFSKDFKKTMGVSPSKFQKEYFNKLT